MDDLLGLRIYVGKKRGWLRGDLGELNGVFFLAKGGWVGRRR